MRTRALAITVACALAGCAPGPSPEVAPPQAEVIVPPAGPPAAEAVPPESGAAAPPVVMVAESPAERAGRVAVSVVGTPFLLVFKTAVCGATVAIAGPIAAFSALTPHGGEAIDTLGEGIAVNCGPPYVVSPRAG